MTKEETLEWKQNLLDEISEATGSMNIVQLKMETEFIFKLCTDMSNAVDCSSSEKDSFLKSFLDIAVSSYHQASDLNLRNRVSFINGMLFVSSCHVLDDTSFKLLSIENKTELLYEIFTIGAHHRKLDFSEEDLSYIKLGMKAKLKTQEKSKGKK